MVNTAFRLGHPHRAHRLQQDDAVAGGRRHRRGAYPDLVQPFGGFPDGVTVEDSHVTMPEIPGVGFEGKSDSYKVMKELVS